MDSVVHDLGSAVRHLRRNLTFLTAAVLILSLGIAAATTIFSASEALLLRPLPYPESERLVSVRALGPQRGSLYERTSAGTLADWQLHVSSFEAITGYRWNMIDVLDGAGSERLNGLFVTPEFFKVKNNLFLRGPLGPSRRIVRPCRAHRLGPTHSPSGWPRASPHRLSGYGSGTFRTRYAAREGPAQTRPVSPIPAAGGAPFMGCSMPVLRSKRLRLYQGGEPPVCSRAPTAPPCRTVW
jgi:hypothetical protein